MGEIARHVRSFGHNAGVLCPWVMTMLVASMRCCHNITFTQTVPVVFVSPTKALKMGLVVMGFTCKLISLCQKPSMCESFLMSLTSHS